MSRGFEENIKYTLFNQFGTFFSLPDQLLSNSTKIQDVYNAILSDLEENSLKNEKMALKGVQQNERL